MRTSTTLAGVALAFAIPFRGSGDVLSPSERLEHSLSRPVAYFILPIFALANAGVILDATALQTVFHSNGAGIIAGLVLGKPIGIVLFSAVAVLAIALPGFGFAQQRPAAPAASSRPPRDRQSRARGYRSSRPPR